MLPHVLHIFNICVSLTYQNQTKMTTQNLTENRGRIINMINRQITMATSENVRAVMIKMVAMLPQFAECKPTMANVDKLTRKAIESYLKYNHRHTEEQANAVDASIEAKRRQSMPSSLQF